MIDTVIKTFYNEREGNDSWLRFKLTLGYDWGDLSLSLSENHDGWGGPIRDAKSFLFKDFEEEALIAKIKDYVNDFAENEAEEKDTLEQLEYFLNNDKLNMNIKLITS